MKSIVADFRRLKTAILTILEALNFDIQENSYLEMSKIGKNAKIRAAKVVKMTKIDFT